MPGPMGTVLQAGYMPGVIASLPPIEGLWRDARVATGKASIAATRLLVVKPFESLPGFLG